MTGSKRMLEISAAFLPCRYPSCCGASEPEASEPSSLKRASVCEPEASERMQSKSKFLASLWVLVVRISYAQLFTNIPLHYHVCDGL